MIDLVIRNARVASHPGRLVDLGIAAGKIVAIESGLRADAEEGDAGGRLVAPGFVETHLHLDKSCILDRCATKDGTLDEAIRETSRAKAGFSPEDVYARAKKTLEKCILNGTTHIRTHVEVDPGIGLKGLEGVLPLVKEYAFAVDLEICVFPQEGMLNNPGTEELMLAALDRGASVLGACPYTDSDAHGQIDRIFDLARERDVDIDMHLDFSLGGKNMDLDHVCRCSEKFRWGGRVACGHVTKLSSLPPRDLDAAAARMKNAGVAVTVLPSTDLYLMGRPAQHDVVRGVAPAHRLLGHGVNCSLATNNVLNPFTPFGDCSLMRMANLYANIAQIGTESGMTDCHAMVTSRAAQLLNAKDYGVAVGAQADFVVLDCETPAQAVAEIAPVLAVYKRGKQTVSRALPQLHRPN
ncbi:amidohydrolase family protein [Variibacter gotjawalensis]|nr:amidohydrolase family protein [Variibacter gotjawalensis]NIK49321.1 cytosine deaminase [Variibacter gotjawalensis]